MNSIGGLNMSKWDKLLERICSLSNDLRFEELQKVLEYFGYEMKGTGSGSSHFTFRKKGCAPIKKTYVKMVKDVVESEGDNSDD